MLTNDCGCTSFVQSETQTRVLQGVILSMYEINIITHIFFFREQNRYIWSEPQLNVRLQIAFKPP